MSKQNAAKNKTTATPGPGVFHPAPNVQEPRVLSRVQPPGMVTAADLNEVLTILPMSKIHLASMVRYGDDIWPPIEQARAMLEELKGRIV